MSEPKPMNDAVLGEMREWARDGFGYPNMTVATEVWQSIIARLDAVTAELQELKSKPCEKCGNMA